MVIGAEFYPQNGPKRHGYAHVEEYYQNPKNTYAHMEDYNGKEDCYNNNSTSNKHMMKTNPYMTSPQPIKHGLVGQEDYACLDNYFAHQPQKHMSHDIHGHGYGKQHSNGINYGEEEEYYSQPHRSGYYGHDGHANGKKMNAHGMYETDQHESYTHMGPIRYESASYEYHGESPNYGQKNKKNWAVSGNEWIAKGL